MLLDELLDVALIARLRPAALIVATRLLIELVDDLLEAPGSQPVDLALFASDNGDDRPVATRDEGNERREVEVAAHANTFGDGLREQQRAPVVVEGGGEDGKPVRAVTLELVVEPPSDALEVRLQPEAPLVREIGPVDLLGLVQDGIHSRLRVPRRRHLRRIQVQVEADGTAVLGAERRELAQSWPGHGSRHRPPVGYHDGAILCLGSPEECRCLRSATASVRSKSWSKRCARPPCRRSSTFAASRALAAIHSSTRRLSPRP